MKSLFSKYVWLQLILSILLLFGGAVIIAFAINNNTEVFDPDDRIPAFPAA